MNYLMDNEANAYSHYLSHILPPNIAFDRKYDMFSQLIDGYILAASLNHLKNGIIDMSTLHEPIDMDGNNAEAEAIYNLDKVLVAAENINIKTNNIKAEQIYNKEKKAVLNLLSQIIKRGIIGHYKLKDVQGIISLLKYEEDIETFMELYPEEIILRWINYHLENAFMNEYFRNISQPVDLYPNPGAFLLICTNFGTDLKDSKIILSLLFQLFSTKIDEEEFLGAFSEVDLGQRAMITLKLAEKMGLHEYASIESILNCRSKENFLFIANVFRNYAGLNRIHREGNIAKNSKTSLSSPDDCPTEFSQRAHSITCNMSVSIQDLKLQIENILAHNIETEATSAQDMCEVKNREFLRTQLSEVYDRIKKLELKNNLLLENDLFQIVNTTEIPIDPEEPVIKRKRRSASCFRWLCYGGR